MVDFEKARNEALAYISLTEFAQRLSTQAVHRLCKVEKQEPKLAKYIEVWEATTEICLNDDFQQVRLYVGIPLEFPLTLPKIYLAQADRERLKYLPHVDEYGYVCAFDDESVHINWQHPGEIVKQCIIKVRNVLEEGLLKSNLDDFEDEFIAYWDQKYGKRDEVSRELSMINNDTLPDAGFLNLLEIVQGYKGYRFIVHNDSDEFKMMKQYLLDTRYKVVEGSVLFLGLAGNSLPFDETNESAYNLVMTNFPEFVPEFQRYISKGKNPMVILFARAVKDKYIFYGWRIGPFPSKRSGFREKTLTPWYHFTKSFAREPVVRLTFDTFTSSRLMSRTDGLRQLDFPKRIVMVGLGSIGSNIMPYFTSLRLESLDLIDPDHLSVENVNRHLLGMNFLKRYKVNALEEYLRSANPLLNVKGHHSSIVSIMVSQPEMLKEADLVVICIGKTNIEEFIISKLVESQANNAVVIIWVEPFLIGGHCLYLRPSIEFEFGRLFENGIFKFNIIDESEYLNQKKSMLLKESGCQSSYLPYGRQSIMRFLAVLHPYLLDLVDSPVEKNFGFSFRGSEAVHNQTKLRLSQFGEQFSSDSIKKLDLNDDTSWPI